jgi:hypothetical protein
MSEDTFVRHMLENVRMFKSLDKDANILNRRSVTDEAVSRSAYLETAKATKLHVLDTISPPIGINARTPTFILSDLILCGEIVKLHSLPLDMFGFFSKSYFWPSTSRDRYLSYINLQEKHLEIFQKEDLDIHRHVLESIEFMSEMESMMENVEDNGVAEKVEDNEDQVKDGQRELMVESNNDDVELKVRLMLII